MAGLYQWANLYRSMGYSIIPITSSKLPAIKWKQFQERRPTREELASWFIGSKYRIGIVTGSVSGGLYVVDCDSRELAERYYRKHRDSITTMVRSRRGIHFYHRGEGANFMRKGVDGRGEGGYVVAPPSPIGNGRSYEWITPLLKPTELLPLPFAPPAPVGSGVDSERIRNVRAYIRAIHSISGQRGHNKAYKVACKLVEAGLSEAEALVEMEEWNATNASPPWSRRELLHKVKSAYARFGRT